MSTHRASWDKYFMQLCDFVAQRATCDRKHVGSVLVKKNRIISTGYNGSIPGLPHCDDVGHDMENNHCIATIHSECNAILTAARLGIPTEGCTLYCNVFPCWKCFQMIIGAGIIEVVYAEDYNSRHYDKVKSITETIPEFNIRRFREN